MKIKKSICGDFNIDLLKIETVGLYQDYYNLLYSFGLLPHIIQPTRIVESQTPSIIDNIFSNNLSDEITACNLLITFSEHLSQFISVIKGNNDYKNFSAESFNQSINQSINQNLFSLYINYKYIHFNNKQMYKYSNNFFYNE